MDNTDRRRRRKQHKATLHDSEEVSSIEWEFINMTEQEEDLIFRMHRLVGFNSRTSARKTTRRDREILDNEKQ
ncbi:transcription factor TRY isoform X2 [Brassica napus]|uniref:transcription factor TRY isoform X2 n=1 Tax=Brassica napus TaxID=3708 RepID=UPI002079E0A6|nr:transcription factor TRY isoform X2 [Brassica napus]